MRLSDFVHESNRIEGIHGASQADVEAHEDFLSSKGGVDDLITFVSRVAQAPFRRLPGQNVRVGAHIAPPGGPMIEEMLKEVLKIEDIYDQHCAFLTLHPFMDGNGRSARALWLKRMGGEPPRIGFLHKFYYQTLEHADDRS